MITKEKKNGHLLEEIRLNDSGIKTFTIRTTDDFSSGKVGTMVRNVGGKMTQVSKSNGEVLTLTSRDALLALRKYNEINNDEVKYEVL